MENMKIVKDKDRIKTKVEFVYSDKDNFKEDVQIAIDAIELNVNNEITDIQYNVYNDEIYTAVIVYKQDSKNSYTVLSE